MATKRTLRRGKKPATNTSKKRTLRKSQSSANARELASIERVLGEDFESLSEARKALQRETTKTVKKAQPRTLPKSITKKRIIELPPPPTFRPPAPPIVRPAAPPPPAKLNKSQRTYTVRELNAGERQTVEKFLTDFEATRSINQLRNKDEYWGGEVPWKVRNKQSGVNQTGVARTFNVYKDIFALFSDFARYAANLRKKGTPEKTIAAWLNTIKVVKFKGSSDTWKKTREKIDKETRTGAPNVSKSAKKSQRKKGGKK